METNALSFDERFYNGAYAILYEFCKGKTLPETVYIFKNKGFRMQTLVLYAMEHDRLEDAELTTKHELWGLVKHLGLRKDDKIDICRCLFFVKKYVE